MHTVFGPEDVKPFVESHGGNPAKLKGEGHGDGRWLFSDGASLHLNAWGASFAEPPDDHRELLAIRREYFIAKLGRAQQDFLELKAACLNGGGWRWPEDEYGKPPTDRDEYDGSPDPRPALKILQRLVIERRETLEEIDREISALVENRRETAKQRQNEMLDQQAAERDQALHDEIAKITI